MKMTGRLAHVFAVIIALLMTLTLLLSALCAQATRLLSDEGLHQRVALDPAVSAAQMERITAAVGQIAAEQSFAPETALSLITPEGLADYNRQVISWWMSLARPDAAMDAPQWDSEALENAVREDPLFQEAVRSTLRRTVARDQVGYPISLAVQETVLPVRTQLLAFALPMVQSYVKLSALVGYALNTPVLFAALSLAMAMLIVLLMGGDLRKTALYAGSALSAAALVTLLAMLTVHLLDPGAIVAQANALLGLQITLLLHQLGSGLGLICAIELVAGIWLIFLHQRRVRVSAGSAAA